MHVPNWRYRNTEMKVFIGQMGLWKSSDKNRNTIFARAYQAEESERATWDLLAWTKWVISKHLAREGDDKSLRHTLKRPRVNYNAQSTLNKVTLDVRVAWISDNREGRPWSSSQWPCATADISARGRDVIIVSSFSSSPPRPHDLTIAPFTSRCCSCPLIEGGGGGGGDEDDDDDVTTTSTWTIARLEVNGLQRNATTAAVLKTSDTHCRRFSQSPAVGPQVWDVRECVCVCTRARVCVVASSWIARVCGDSFTERLSRYRKNRPREIKKEKRRRGAR